MNNDNIEKFIFKKWHKQYNSRKKWTRSSIERMTVM